MLIVNADIRTMAQRDYPHGFVEVRGQFIRIALFIIWTPLILMNLFNVFITDPHMVVENGERRFVYGISPWIVVPVLLAVGVILFKACYRRLQHD